MANGINQVYEDLTEADLPAPGAVPTSADFSVPGGNPYANNPALARIYAQIEREGAGRRKALESQMQMIEQQAQRYGQEGMSPLDKASILFQAAGALAAPTRSGGLMESIGSAGSAVSGPLMKAAQAKRDREEKVAQLQMARAKLAAEMGSTGPSASELLQLYRVQQEGIQKPSEKERLLQLLPPEERAAAVRGSFGLTKAPEFKSLDLPDGRKITVKMIDGLPYDPITNKPITPEAIAEMPRKTEKLPFSSVKEFAEQGGVLKTYDELGTGFKDTYADKTFSAVGDVQNWIGSRGKLGYGDQADWWSEYYRQRNVARNALFGSALTKTEAAAFEKTDINPGMDPKQIRKNLERQRELARSAAFKLGSSMSEQGFDKNAIESAIGYKLDDLSKRQAPARGGAGDPLAAAREAIKKGAPREAVIRRLKENGIDPSGL
jgi:hypothetical protein